MACAFLLRAGFGEEKGDGRSGSLGTLPSGRSIGATWMGLGIGYCFFTCLGGGGRDWGNQMLCVLCPVDSSEKHGLFDIFPFPWLVRGRVGRGLDTIDGTISIWSIYALNRGGLWRVSLLRVSDLCSSNHVASNGDGVENVESRDAPRKGKAISMNEDLGACSLPEADLAWICSLSVGPLILFWWVILLSGIYFVLKLFGICRIALFLSCSF